MKVRDVLKRLREDGWVVVRTRGDHRQLKHPTKPGLVTVAGKPGEIFHQERLRVFGVKPNWRMRNDLHSVDRTWGDELRRVGS